MNFRHHLFANQTPARRRTLTILLLTLWTLAFASIPVRNFFEKPAWDVAIYLNGVRSVAKGHDPYADAVAIQQEFHATLAQHPNAQVPFSYVYSPITLPALHLVAALPLWVSGLAYWSIYLLGVLAQIYAGFGLAEDSERDAIVFLTPVAAFFPGLLASDILWSGNVAFILYGLAMATAVIGWRRNTWKWFYLAVLAASCVKAPLLSLLVIPVLSARRQWLSAGITAVAGFALFAMQPLFWPSLFHNYLRAVELQFSYNRDFGISPAGLFSGYLFDHGIPYSPACYFFYLGYAIPLVAILFYLSRRYLKGAFSLAQWLPVLLVGVILLNPRVLEYDEILLALPLTLIGWRFFASFLRPRLAILAFFVVFFGLNAIAYQSWSIWKLTDGPLLITFFCVGCWTLLHQSKHPIHPTSRKLDEFDPKRTTPPARELQSAQNLLSPADAASHSH